MTTFVSWTCTATQAYHPAHPPAGAKKAYNALIKGRDPLNTFVREFVAKSFVVDRTTVPALLESRDVDKKGRADDTYLLLLAGEGELCIRHTITKELAVWFATQMGLGRKLEDCWDPITKTEIPLGRVVPLGEPEPDPLALMEAYARSLRQALVDALTYIDAIPADVAAALPAMPGFARDPVEELLAATKELA